MSWIKKYGGVIAFNILVILVLLASLETAFLLLVRNPAVLKSCPRSIRNTVGHLYAQERSTIQFLPECARYDEELGYTLKPGACTFSGREFSTRYEINRLGLRDDEASLAGPDVVVLGDSFAMGWGVEHEEAFPKVLEKRIGLNVLNAAISSYGTAREMILLRRIPRDRLRYLVIQYCGNDYEENREFHRGGKRLRVMSAGDYHSYGKVLEKSKDYFFGKYLLLKIQKKLREWRQRSGEAHAASRDPDEVELFIHAVVNGGVDLEGVRLITFVMNGRNPADNLPFTEALRQRVAQSNGPRYIRDMIVLDLSGMLYEDHFFVLDDHLNRGGHEVIAGALAKIILEAERPPR